MFFVPHLSPLDSALDYVTFSFVVSLLFLSLLSLSFIFYFYVRSRSSLHLQRFNSLWAVRFLFVLFITLWSINELLRLPSFQRRYLFPFLHRLSVPWQGNLCKTHLVLSVGFFEPGFLVTLLFLLKVSVNKTTPRFFWALAFVFSSSLPILTLQLFFIVFSRLEVELPEIFYRSWAVVKNPYEDETALCAYPLLGTFVFAAFGAVYSLSFILTCSELLSLVINKALRIRIYALAIAVLVTLPLETLFLGLSVLWTPDRVLFRVSALVVFMSTFVCAVVGEGVLVIRPISDALAAEGDSKVEWSAGRQDHDGQESAV